MVRFSGKARKTNHIPFFASEVCLHPESLRESYGLSDYKNPNKTPFSRKSLIRKVRFLSIFIFQ
ncbi:MAG: hypothetical protein U5L45_11715 [Saprospiraceae bacterium]|nr:hypothetical protein [Saprospiraceae bacterium]